jgi:signal transduction histidine kinase
MIASHDPRSTYAPPGDARLLARVAEVALVLRAAEPLGPVAETIAAAVGEAWRGARAHLFLIDERTGALRPWREGESGGAGVLPTEGGVLEWLLRHEEPLFAERPSPALPGSDPGVPGWPGGALVGMPLVCDGVLRGLWVATLRGPYRLSESERRFAHFLGDALALALEQHRRAEAAAESAAQMERLELRAQEGEQLLGQMLSVVAHEMRTPLTCIKAYAETLIDTPEDQWPSRTPFLEIINEECDRLGRLLTNALDYSRLESGQRSLHLSTLQPADLLQDVLLTLGPESARRRVRLESRVAADLGTVEGDLDLLKQLCINLVANAVKFSPEGSCVELAAAGRPDTWILEVLDRGPGIPEDQRERVFERFYRVEQEGRRVPGTGLGLAIARGISELHGGRIRALGRDGGGSTLRVELPRAQRAPEAARRLAGDLWQRPGFERMLGEAVRVVADVLEAQIVSAMLVDPERGDLRVASALGLEADARKRRVGYRGGISGKALAEATPVLVNDIETDPRFRRPNHPQYSTKSLLCVPILVEGHAVGVVNVNNKRSREPFDENDLVVVRTIIERVAEAAQRSRAFPHAAELATETLAALRASLSPKQEMALRQLPPHALAPALARRLGAGAADAKRLATLAGGAEVAASAEEPRTAAVWASGAERRRVPVAIGRTAEILCARRERWDGGGWPSGVSGQAIPLGARILAVVDGLHALTRGNPARPAMSCALALAALESQAGRRYDAAVVAALAALLAERGADRLATAGPSEGRAA